MGNLKKLYGHSLALLTDLYQLTMAYGYWKLGMTRSEATFHVVFRRNPFRGGYAVACGVEHAVEFLETLSFTNEDIDYLAGLTGNDGAPLFERSFLDHLSELRFACDVDAVPEGTVVFPHEPLLRVTGPLAHCQLVETAVLNLLNFQTLIATKSARICGAAEGEPVLEFGLRRAQGIDGSVSASRAAYIGGCAATSNVLAGKLYGIPVKGTHAHSWVMCFDDELSSFEAYAKAMPNNCIFLVDTYDTLEGVKHAANMGLKLREAGHEMVGIRLDSGDLAYLSIEARRILDDAGLNDAKIVASNDLDEHVISSLKSQGATIALWGVGTRLATAFDDPALGGVYKLSALRKTPDQPWSHRIKLSEQTAKVTTPGILQVKRFERGGEFIGDMIYDELSGAGDEAVLVDPTDFTRRKRIPHDASSEDLLRPVMRKGRTVNEPVELPKLRERTLEQLNRLHGGIKRLINPHEYPLGLEEHLHKLKTQLILEARDANSSDGKDNNH